MRKIWRSVVVVVDYWRPSLTARSPRPRNSLALCAGDHFAAPDRLPGGYRPVALPFGNPFGNRPLVDAPGFGQIVLGGNRFAGCQLR